VRRDHLAWRENPLDDRERAAEVLRRHLVGYVQGGKVGAFIWTNEDLLVLLRCHGIFLPLRLGNEGIVAIDELTEEQARYLVSWEEGT
jgi:hypothetical protein